MEPSLDVLNVTGPADAVLTLLVTDHSSSVTWITGAVGSKGNWFVAWLMLLSLEQAMIVDAINAGRRAVAGNLANLTARACSRCNASLSFGL